MDLRRRGGHLVALGLLLAVSPAGAIDLAPPPDPNAVVGALLWADLERLPGAERPRVALALGGGGARGLAHVGVLRALERRGVPVDAIAGTSIGAFVGALSAAGAPAARIEEIGRTTNWNQLAEVRLFSWPGIFSTRRLETYLNALLRDLRGGGEVTFESLEKRFVCVAADLETGEEVVFQSGPVAPAVRASTAVPGLFEPFEHAGRTYIDGGVVNNLPVDHARRLGADVVVAVDVEADTPAEVPRSPVEVLVQVIRIQGAKLTGPRREAADVVVRPAVGSIRITELDRAEEAIRAGRFAGEAAADRIRAEVIARAIPALLRPRPPGRIPLPRGLPIEVGSAASPAAPEDEARGHRQVLARARAAAARGDWVRVLGEVENLRGLRGRAEAGRLAAAAALRLGLADEALGHAEAAVRADDAPAEAWVLLAQARIAAGDPVAALSALDEAARRGRDEPFWRAWALEAAGRLDEALDLHRRTAAAGPPDAATAARVRLAFHGAPPAPGEPPAAALARAYRAARDGDMNGARRAADGLDGPVAAAIRSATAPER